MLLEGVVGERRGAVGTEGDARLGPYSEVIVGETGFGRYFEAVRVGRMWSLSAVGFTLVAANATALAATTQLVVGIVNPIGSTRAAVICRAGVQTRSGTPAGPFYLTAGLTSGGITTAAAGTVVNALTYEVSPTIKAYNNVALTGFVSQGGVLQVPVGGPAAVAAGAGIYSTDIEFAGMVIVPPSGVCGILATGAGTTHIVDAAIYWVGVDWPL